MALCSLASPTLRGLPLIVRDRFRVPRIGHTGFRASLSSLGA